LLSKINFESFTIGGGTGCGTYCGVGGGTGLGVCTGGTGNIDIVDVSTFNATISISLSEIISEVLHCDMEDSFSIEHFLDEISFKLLSFIGSSLKAFACCSSV
jgi:hypothetical protein